jgi:hypothetical protein
MGFVVNVWCGSERLQGGVKDFSEHIFWTGANANQAVTLAWDRPGFATVRLRALPCRQWAAIPSPPSQNFGCSPTIDTKVMHFTGPARSKEDVYWKEVSLGRPRDAIMLAIQEAQHLRGVGVDPDTNSTYSVLLADNQ